MDRDRFVCYGVGPEIGEVGGLGQPAEGFCMEPLLGYHLNGLFCFSTPRLGELLTQVVPRKGPKLIEAWRRFRMRCFEKH